MLTFEKVMEVFKDYLTEDTRYEIVKTSHGYTTEINFEYKHSRYSNRAQTGF